MIIKFAARLNRAAAIGASPFTRESGRSGWMPFDVPDVPAYIVLTHPAGHSDTPVMDSVLGILRAEHRRIVDGTSLALAVADRLERGETVPTGTLSALANFFAYAVHRNHRDKEDSLLFPRLRQKGLAEGLGCVSILLTQHSESAISFARMLSAAEAYENGDRQAIGAWIMATRQYVEALQSHIRHEEEELFPQAERLLTTDDLQELAAAFAKAEERARFTGIDEVLEDYERVAQTLTNLQLPQRS